MLVSKTSREGPYLVRTDNRRGLGPALPVESVRDLWERFVRILDRVTEQFEARFSNALRTLDKLKHTPQPGAAESRLLKECLAPDSVLVAGFLDGLGVVWLPLLVEGGFFI